VKAQIGKTSPSPLPDQALQAVDRDAPLRLATAAKLAFPMGGVTASGLRREAQRGNLVIERIAGKDFTTLRAIEQMREKCRIRQKAVVSTSDEISNPPQFGSSGTPDAKLALAAARAIISRRKESSPNTSSQNTSRRRATRPNGSR
jgi:hypothetical protein